MGNSHVKELSANSAKHKNTEYRTCTDKIRNSVSTSHYTGSKQSNAQIYSSVVNHLTSCWIFLPLPCC